MRMLDSIDEERPEAEDRMSTDSSNEQSHHQQGAVSSISLSSTMFENLGLNFREEETHYFDDEKIDDLVDVKGTKNKSHSPTKSSSSAYNMAHYDATNPFINTSLTNHAENTLVSCYGRLGGEGDYDYPRFDRSLCWRLDPSVSLSDWTLQIFNRSTRSFETYHVHRVVLAVGPRACGYFQDVFRKHELKHVGEATASSKATRVPLIAQACQLIPLFLDFMYGKNDNFDLSYENAMGLLHVADFFQNHALLRLASNFIESDLEKSPEHLYRYYSDAMYYDLQELLVRVLHACTRALMTMKDDEGDDSYYAKLLDEMSAVHFAQIMAEINNENSEHYDDDDDNDEPKESDICMTRLVSKYCALHENELPIDIFERLIRHLKVLDSSAALTLLEFSLEYNLARYQDRKEYRDTVSSVIFFQRECIGTLSEEWEELLGLDQARVTRVMETLSTRVEHQTILVDWFQKTLIRAATLLSTARAAKESIERSHGRVQTELKAVSEELKHTQKELESLRLNYTTTKTELKDQISGWIKKNEGQLLERKLENQKWDQERLQWELERQQWECEKANISRQMSSLRDELHDLKSPNRGMPNNYTIRSFLDDSNSIVTDDSSEQSSSVEENLELEDPPDYQYTFNHLLIRNIDGVLPSHRN